MQYSHNQKAWMTGYLFSEWLYNFDRHIKHKKNRPVLLLMDDVASHFPEVELECVRPFHLPSNTTSHLQPLDAGIIRAFKAHYRSLQVKRFVELIEKDQKPDLNLKEAVRFVAMAWRSVSATTIQNCWKHTGIMPGLDVDSQVPEDPVQDLSTLLNCPQLTSAGCLSAESYLDQDETLDTGELPTEEDILAVVSRETDTHNDHNSDSEEDHLEDDPTPSPTSQQAFEAVRILQHSFSSRDCVEGNFAMIGVNMLVTKLSAQTRTQTQSTLFDHFRRL